MAFRVVLLPKYAMPRRRGGVIYYPGKEVIYERRDDIPELVRQDAENFPGLIWLIEEIDEKPKKTRAKKDEPKSEIVDEE